MRIPNYKWAKWTLYSKNLESSFSDIDSYETTSPRALAESLRRGEERKHEGFCLRSPKSTSFCSCNQYLFCLKGVSGFLDIITMALTEAGVARQAPNLDWGKRREGDRQARSGEGVRVE